MNVEMGLRPEKEYINGIFVAGPQNHKYVYCISMSRIIRSGSINIPRTKTAN
jgi:hypothetical protein